MAKVLMPIGDATEVLDTLYPFFRLPEDGFEVVVAGSEARWYHGVMHEIPPNEQIPWKITREQPSYHIKATIAFRPDTSVCFSAAAERRNTSAMIKTSCG